ncbi:hypothetical protein [Sorangium sp. So ce233]|uniref:hypothetical protein n=1 Tax=Sorangium sp. So ce233 TaxID=3133290 RepID=UPI003F6419B2
MPIVRFVERIRSCMNVILLSLFAGPVAGCAATIQLPSKEDVPSGGKARVAQSDFGDDKLAIPWSLYREDGALMPEARNCAIMHNEAIDKRNNSQGGNITFKIGQIAAAGVFGIANGINAQLDDDEHPRAKENLQITSIVATGMFAALASFDNWYNFSGHVSGYEADATARITHLQRAGRFMACASNARASDGRRLVRIHGDAVNAAKELGEAALAARLAAPGWEFRQWQEFLAKTLEATDGNVQAALADLENAGAASYPMKVDDASKRLAANLKPKFVSSTLKGVKDPSDKASLVEAINVTGERWAKLALLRDYADLPVGCGGATEQQRTAAELEQAAHAELIQCLGSTPVSFGSLSQGPGVASSGR